uniref:Uncharacterized protein n=1 Tax=viral metagenome TaxID=1070528 RepID=A0A6C0LKT4_9ZZZZ
MANKTRKRVPWSGWSKIAPSGKQRTQMYKKCGNKCFLGTKTKKETNPGSDPGFPICKKNTCKISKKGTYAAYVRAREWGNKRRTYKGRSKPRFPQNYYTRIARKAKRILKNMFNVTIKK